MALNGMRVLVLTAKVPFVQGGAELLAKGLCTALEQAGHSVELVSMPFKWYPPDRIPEHMLACRLLDLTESSGLPIDRLICLKFPAYVVEHERKVVWLLHQHRMAYDCWDSEVGDLVDKPNGHQIRALIHDADRRYLSTVGSLFAISRNVAGRLLRYSGLGAEVLYPPPAGADRFYCADPDSYFFMPGRLSIEKRQLLGIRALARTRHPVRLRIAGFPGATRYSAEVAATVEELGLRERVEFEGTVSAERMRELYGRSVGVVYPTLDEDFGYVTVEAMLSSKPVIVCTDGGGAAELVVDRTTGLIVAPSEADMAEALDELWEERCWAAELGVNGRDLFSSLDISWAKIVEHLIDGR